MSDDLNLADPNAPSDMQIRLQQVASAIRRKGECELILALDGICLMTDQPEEQSKQIVALTRRLAEK